jgi:hypothetical protein
MRTAARLATNNDRGEVLVVVAVPFRGSSLVVSRGVLQVDADDAVSIFSWMVNIWVGVRVRAIQRR